MPGRARAAMDFETISWVWLGAGVLLGLTEFVVPGLIAVFLGLGAGLVAAGRWVGWIEGEMTSFTAWFILSLLLTIGFRGLAGRLLPAEKSFDEPEDDLQIQGSVVKVIRPVGETDSGGRVRFRGSSWPATSLGGPLKKGQEARLVYRENLVWMVEPIAEGEEDETIE